MSENLRFKVSFRLTNDEGDLLDHITKHSKMSRSEFLRSAFRYYSLNSPIIHHKKTNKNGR